MMTNEMIRYVQGEMMREASKIRYTVASEAPSNDRDLFNSTSLVIWSGASDLTIFGAAEVNHAFRAIHDTAHLKTGLALTVDAEIELARIQANTYSSGLIADLTYIEVAGQAEYFKKYGCFPTNQVEFTVSRLKAMGYLK